jgi:hypothetical protein
VHGEYRAHTMTRYRRRPALDVNLSASQRRVLEAFFAGHLPAGQLDGALAAATQMDTSEVDAALAAQRPDRRHAGLRFRARARAAA